MVVRVNVVVVVCGVVVTHSTTVVRGAVNIHVGIDGEAR